MLPGMLTIRPAAERGHADHGWLNSYHTFSFADYHDPRHMGFRSLRVINEDRVAPGRGFGRHAHRDMEILSVVLAGALEHRDSIGTGSVIRPDDLQRMSAGTGVLHSEANASRDQIVHFLQIWLIPQRSGLPPSYEQKHFPRGEKLGRLRLLASQDGREGSITVHTDVALHAGIFELGEALELPLVPGRFAWVQLVRGRARINDQELSAGDGAGLSEVEAIRIEGIDQAELLLFDLA